MVQWSNWGAFVDPPCRLNLVQKCNLWYISPCATLPKMVLFMTKIDFNVASNGRMVLPKAIRDAMGLYGEAKVTAIIDATGVRLVPMKEHVRRAQALYRKAVKQPRSTDDFLRDRREEAERENGRFSDAPR